jgi:positive regulator of sigma E activity
MTLEVIDLLGTAKGDRVKIEARAGSAAKSGFILYILPLISLFIGYLFGSKLVSLLGSSATEGWGILSAFLFMALTYLAIYLSQRRFVLTHSLQIRIMKILGNSEAVIGSSITGRSPSGFQNVRVQEI